MLIFHGFVNFCTWIKPLLWSFCCIPPFCPNLYHRLSLQAIVALAPHVAQALLYLPCHIWNARMCLRKECADAHNRLFLILTNNCLSFVLKSSYGDNHCWLFERHCWCYQNRLLCLRLCSRHQLVRLGLGKPILQKSPSRLFKTLVAINKPGSIRVHVFHASTICPIYENCLYWALIISSLKVIFQSGTWNVILCIVMLKPQQKNCPSIVCLSTHILTGR